MEKFSQAPANVMAQNLGLEWRYSDFVSLDGKIDLISPQGIKSMISNQFIYFNSFEGI